MNILIQPLNLRLSFAGKLYSKTIIVLTFNAQAFEEYSMPNINIILGGKMCFSEIIHYIKVKIHTVW